MKKKSSNDNPKSNTGNDKNVDTDEKKLASVLSNVNNLNKAKEIISSLTVSKRQELRSILKSSETTDYYNLKKKLSEKDIQKLLSLIDEADKKITLFNTNELRPTPFSKTVTIFDVYVTNEEEFVPYVSPLATVGTIEKSSSNDNVDGSIDDMGDISGMGDTGLGLGGLTGGSSEGENKGLFGIGFLGL